MEEIERERRQWLLVAAAALGARELPELLVEIHVGPAHRRRLAASACGHERKLPEGPEWLPDCVECLPDSADLAVREHALAALLLAELLDGSRRVRVDDLFLDRPGEQALQGCE